MITKDLLIAGQGWPFSCEEMASCVSNVLGESWLNLSEELLHDEILCSRGEDFIGSNLFAFEDVSLLDEGGTDKVLGP